MSNNIIVTTTIQPPTPATLEFLKHDNWKFIIVGDQKTPHDAYKELSEKHHNLIYLDCDEQDKLYPELSAVIGWKTIQRRNIGYAHAYNLGADIIISVDDDNIPYSTWGWNMVNKITSLVDVYDCETPIFDPLSVTNHNYLWHRGFPLSLASKKNKTTYMGKTTISVAVQADLWDGDPDIDAFQRMTIQPCVKFDVSTLYKGGCTTVFDSQNTFLSKECFPHYFVMPFVGRMDDIFGGYHMQVMRPDLNVVFGPSSVYQQRNEHDLRVDMRKEHIGYEHALEFVDKLKYNRNLEDCVGIIPKEVVEFYNVYQKAFRI